MRPAYQARGQTDLCREATGPRKGRAVVPMNSGARAALMTAKEAALSDHVIEWAGAPVTWIRKGDSAPLIRLASRTYHPIFSGRLPPSTWPRRACR